MPIKNKFKQFLFPIKIIPSKGVNSLSFGEDGVLASSSADMSVKLWDVASGSLLMSLEQHSDTVRAVAFNNDGVLASASDDRTIKLWDTATGTLLSTLRDQPRHVNGLAFGEGNVMAVGALSANTVQLWRCT
jgi:WD40 repeat protein